MTHIPIITPVGIAPDPGAVTQIERCAALPHVSHVALMADHHKGYGVPIGGVLASPTHIAPGGVGYDIGCGNKAVRTDLQFSDIARDLPRLMDAVFTQLSFGVGRKNAEKAEHALLDDADRWKGHIVSGARELAASQLGTIGSGNHYVDLLVDRSGWVWVGVHFGSRGLGHKTATAFLRLLGSSDDMDAAPAMVAVDSPTGSRYLEHMALAGDFAHAGRDWVCAKVLRLLGGREIDSVHNHHNYAWRETHGGRSLWVVRKGATPAFPGQLGFIGGSMGDDAVIVSGTDHPDAAPLLHSTVHGAGRVMSRTEARGKVRRSRVWRCGTRDCNHMAPWSPPNAKASPPRCPTHQRAMVAGTTEDVVRAGVIDWPGVQQELRSRGLELRGAGADEAPGAYKRLPAVLAAHATTIDILHTLTPVGVAMAGADVADPFRD